MNAREAFVERPPNFVRTPPIGFPMLGASTLNAASLVPPSGFNYLPIELFQTEEAHYIFDAKNIIFIKTNEIIFDILSILKKSNITSDTIIQKLKNKYNTNEIENSINEIHEFQKRGFLIPTNFSRKSNHSHEKIKDKLTNNLNRICLFVTTKCNLSCSYCIYGGLYQYHKQLSQESMPWETAKAAIDLLIKHSVDTEPVRIDFFGGEPTLAFELIKKCMKYAKENRTGTVTGTITSNGTVLTNEMLEYILNNNILMQFSIDVDPVSHDQNRKYRGSNKGSYSDIIANLQKIKTRDYNYFIENLRIKAVVTPETVFQEGESEIDPLLEEIKNVKHFSMLLQEPNYDTSKDENHFKILDEMGNRLIKLKNKSTINELLESFDIKQRFLFMRTFWLFFRVQVWNRSYLGNKDEVPFAMDCLIGHEAAVDTNGEISICQKSKGFIIGNVHNGGWDFESIVKIDQERHKEWELCNSCFCRKFCELCYENMDSKNMDQTRARYCNFNKIYFHKLFSIMLRVMDHNPDLWSEARRQIHEIKEARGLNEVPA